MLKSKAERILPNYELFKSKESLRVISESQSTKKEKNALFTHPEAIFSTLEVI